MMEKFQPDFMKDIDTQEKCQAMAQEERNKKLDCLDEISLQCFRKAYIIAKISANMPVLITGPNGTGKDGYSRLVWNYNDRYKKGSEPLAINCAALNDNLFLSEFFGHVKGAFTGADKEREGKIKTAEKDCVPIFLDEIGELSATCQAALLRYLQNGEIQRVGSDVTEELENPPKVICATNRNLEEEVAAGRFREDLLGRIKKFCIEVPPLCKRPKDRFQNAINFLNRFKSKQGEWASALELSPSFEADCKADKYAWPKNFRELENRIYEAIVRNLIRGKSLIDYADLFEEDKHVPAETAEKTMQDFGFPANPQSIHFDLEEKLQNIRKYYIEKALNFCKDNKTNAADALRYSNFQKMDRAYLGKKLKS